MVLSERMTEEEKLGGETFTKADFAKFRPIIKMILNYSLIIDPNALEFTFHQKSLHGIMGRPVSPAASSIEELAVTIAI